MRFDPRGRTLAWSVGLVAAAVLGGATAGAQGPRDPARGMPTGEFDFEDATDRGAIEAYLQGGQAEVDSDGKIVPGNLDGVPERMRRDLEQRLEREDEARRKRLEREARDRPAPPPAEPTTATDANDEDDERDTGVDVRDEWDELDEGDWVDDPLR